MSAAEAVRGFPFEGVALPDGNGRATVWREALADRLRECEAAQLEAFEQALALATERASVAFQAQEGWVDGLRAGLMALLEFFDEEPALARYLVVGSAQAGEAVLERRREVLDRIAVVLDDERAPARSYPPPLTAQAVASGVLGVLHARLSQPDPGALAGLAGPLMSFTVLPFLGVRAARRELARPLDGSPATHSGVPLDLLRDPAGRLNPRAASVMMVIADEPGLNNIEVARRAGVTDDGHCSRLLARLQRLGLIETTGDPHRRFAPKAWRLTLSGEQLQEAIRRDAAKRAPSVALDLPPEFEGRLDDRAVVVLRVIGEQPWLSNREVAERAGVKDEAQAARLLERLVDLRLAESTRDARRRGAPNLWQLTEAGELLGRQVGGAAPASPRSVALDLMRDSGGRLSDRAVSVLRVVGADPGLSNGEVGERVGIGAPTRTSQLLARLARRGLIENTRSSGRENVWQLTPGGEQLERAIWQETPPAAQRTLAVDLLRDRGGRLNHRVVSVLGVIGAEPGHSNLEIAERVGIEGKGHASTLLARLARFGLIENVVVDPAPFEANAWQLTGSGSELEAATQDDGQRTAPRTTHVAVRLHNRDQEAG